MYLDIYTLKIYTCTYIHIYLVGPAQSTGSLGKNDGSGWARFVHKSEVLISRHALGNIKVGNSAGVFGYWSWC